MHSLPGQKMSLTIKQQSTYCGYATDTFFRDMENGVCVGEFSKDDSKFSV
jgi:hypothetical protein